MFSSPSGAVIGASDVEATAAFFRLFGFDAGARATVTSEQATALYGVSRELDQQVLTMPGASAGFVRLVGPVDARPAVADPFATGAQAFDLYTRDIAAAVELLRASGWRTGPVGHVELGPLVMDQVMVHGPDDLVVVLIDSQRRRPSMLDSAPDAAFSEGHSFIWAVPSMDAALDFWRGLPGLTVPFDAPIAHPEVNRFMELPDADAQLRMAMVCDPEVTPMRFELLEFIGRKGTVRGSWPLSAGLHAPQFEVDDLDAALGVLAPDAAFGAVVEIHGTRAVTAVAPGDVRFELWERV